MAIKKEDVIHIAKLADLNLSENEIERYTKDMQEILEFANMINSVNTEGMNETIASNEKVMYLEKMKLKALIIGKRCFQMLQAKMRECLEYQEC